MRGEEVKLNQSLHHGSGSRDRRKERMSQSLGKIEIPPTEPQNEHSIQHRSIHQSHLPPLIPIFKMYCMSPLPNNLSQVLPQRQTSLYLRK